MITLKDFLTASGKYPEREHHPEVTPEVLANAHTLLEKVNNFLNELEITSVVVSSGFRPSEVNANIGNAAKKSLHMTGRAIDLVDPKGELDKLVSSRDDLKKKYDLWQEDPGHTVTWCHLDDKNRGERDNNTFIP